MPTSRARRVRRARLRLEVLEDRCVPATLTVNSLGDSGAGSGDAGDLRYCIARANALSGSDTIQFSVSGTIALGSALADVSDDLVIDGPGANSIRVQRSSSAQTQFCL